MRKKRYAYYIKTGNMTDKEFILSTIKSKEIELSRYGIKSIGLFGSYARNEQSKNSDIDILIDFESDKENFDNYMAVYDIIENLFKNYKIEIVTKNGLSPYIGPTILNEVTYV
jgi:predicted nucleotidyltransferase